MTGTDVYTQAYSFLLAALPQEETRPLDDLFADAQAQGVNWTMVARVAEQHGMKLLTVADQPGRFWLCWPTTAIMLRVLQNRSKQ
jgi:hypothetical protein